MERQQQNWRCNAFNTNHPIPHSVPISHGSKVVWRFTHDYSILPRRRSTGRGEGFMHALPAGLIQRWRFSEVDTLFSEEIWSSHPNRWGRYWHTACISLILCALAALCLHSIYHSGLDNGLKMCGSHLPPQVRFLMAEEHMSPPLEENPFHLMVAWRILQTLIIETLVGTTFYLLKGCSVMWQPNSVSRHDRSRWRMGTFTNWGSRFDSSM